jgi:hypothetical protein
MTTAISKRLCRLEVAIGSSTLPTIEDFLFALDRINNPPPDYTDEHRERDVNLFYRWDEFWERAQVSTQTRRG